MGLSLQQFDDQAAGVGRLVADAFAAYVQSDAACAVQLLRRASVSYGPQVLVVQVAGLLGAVAEMLPVSGMWQVPDGGWQDVGVAPAAGRLAVVWLQDPVVVPEDLEVADALVVAVVGFWLLHQQLAASADDPAAVCVAALPHWFCSP